MTVMQKTFNLTLDVENQLENTVFSVSQNDYNSVELVITITQDGGDFDLTGSTPRVAIKKPSGMYVYQDGTITNAGQGQFTVTLDTQAYVEVGNHYAEVYLYKTEGSTNKVAVTGSFTYASRSALFNDASLASNNDFASMNNALLGYQQKPLVQAGAPTVIPSYTGQTSYDSTNNLWYIASNNTATTDWKPVYAQNITWGNMVGTLANQTDLQNALNAKFNASGGTMSGALTVDGGAVSTVETVKNTNGGYMMVSVAGVNAFQSVDGTMAGNKDFHIEGYNGTALSTINLNATNVNATGSLQENGTSLSSKYLPQAGGNINGALNVTGTTYIKNNPFFYQHTTNNKGFKITGDATNVYLESGDSGLVGAMPLYIAGGQLTDIPLVTVQATTMNVTGTIQQAGHDVVVQSGTAGTGVIVSLWTGTQAQYTALGTYSATTLYVIVG